MRLPLSIPLRRFLYSITSSIDALSTAKILFATYPFSLSSDRAAGNTSD